MTNAKSTKRALLVSLLAMLVCMSMLVGTTFAWFTDSVTSGTNTLTTGTLDIELTHSNKTASNEVVTDTTKLFTDVELWEPEALAYENLTVTNLGTLALKYKLSLITSGENWVNETGGKLSDVLKVAVVEGGVSGTRAEILAAIPDADWMSLVTFVENGVLAADTANNPSATYGVVVYWPESANDDDCNVNNGKTLSSGDVLKIDIGVELVATQNTVEADSLGSDYDELATFPNGGYVIPTYSANATKSDAPDSNGDYTFLAKNENGTFEVSGLVDDTSDDVSVNIEPANASKEVFDVVTEGGKGVQTYDITVENFKGEVTVKIFVGKNLSSVEVYHEGTLLALPADAYNSESGFVTFKTDSFSLYHVVFPQANHLANVTKIGNLDAIELRDNYKLSTGYRFEAIETGAEAADSPYSNWHADFVVTFSQDVAAGTIFLAGQYDKWSENWVCIDVPDVDTEDEDGFEGVKAGQPVRLLAYAGELVNSGNPIYINYNELCEYVKIFQCGAGEVPGFEGENSGLKMTVELRIYETLPMEETGDINSANVETGYSERIGIYSYIFD